VVLKTHDVEALAGRAVRLCRECSKLRGQALGQAHALSMQPEDANAVVESTFRNQ